MDATSKSTYKDSYNNCVDNSHAQRLQRKNFKQVNARLKKDLLETHFDEKEHQYFSTNDRYKSQ